MSSKPETPAASNFLRQIVQADLESGKHQKIVTRFPPEPNGYLHIGHAKSICLNFGLAQEFGGECNLRFDDTNPAKEDQEYIDAIKADVEWLGFKWAGEERYASDYFDQLHEWAIHLIKAGKAFVCDLNAEQMREYRGSLHEPGDKFLLCTDGLWEYVQENEMEQSLAQSASAQEWLAALQRLVVARGKRRHDNYSAVAVWCE